MNYNEYTDTNINLKVYKCRYISGEISDTEHQALGWKKPSEIEAKHASYVYDDFVRIYHINSHYNYYNIK